jgi:hypothetical protein
MANIDPFGVDLDTGKNRTIKTGDVLTDDQGSKPASKVLLVFMGKPASKVLLVFMGKPASKVLLVFMGKQVFRELQD